MYFCKIVKNIQTAYRRLRPHIVVVVGGGGGFFFFFFT